MSGDRIQSTRAILFWSLTLLACSSPDSSAGGDQGSGAAQNGGGSGFGGNSGGAGPAGGASFAGNGVGGGPVGGSGVGGSSGMSGSGGSGAENACGFSTGYAGPSLGRCDATWCDDGTCSVPGAGTVAAKGGFLTLDDFEGPAKAVTSSAASIGLTWPAQDGRTGAWALYAHAAGGAKIETAAAEPGGSPGSVQAFHFSGTGSTAADFYPSTTGLPISNCYDASAYDGISLWLKGNPAAGHSQIKVSLHTPPTQPKLSWDNKKGSGVCESGCYDHFAVLLPVTSTWTRHKIPWANFKRLNCTATTPPVPDNFEPQKMILEVSLSQLDPLQGFDVWVDDVTFDIESRSANNFSEIVTEPIFNEMFGSHVEGMDHSALISAISTYGGAYGTGTLAGDGDTAAKKDEAAAFLAQVAHETGSLTILEEDCSVTCTATDHKYGGRGILQLTHSYNYQAAQDAGFSGIVDNPDLVLTNKQFAFGVGIWFWMTYQSGKGICHNAITSSGLAGTTNIINGIECGTATQDSRVNLYKHFCAALGINPRGPLKC